MTTNDHLEKILRAPIGLNAHFLLLNQILFYSRDLFNTSSPL